MRFGLHYLGGLAIAVAVSAASPAWSADYPPFDKVIEGYKKIDPPSDQPESMAFQARGRTRAELTLAPRPPTDQTSS